MYIGILMNLNEENKNGYKFNKQTLINAVQIIHNKMQYYNFNLFGEYKTEYNNDLFKFCVNYNKICCKFYDIWIENEYVYIKFDCFGKLSKLLQKDLDTNQNVYFGLKAVGKYDDKVMNIDKIISINVLDINPRHNIYKYYKEEE